MSKFVEILNEMNQDDNSLEKKEDSSTLVNIEEIVEELNQHFEQKSVKNVKELQPPKKKTPRSKKVSLFDIDKKTFNDKTRWINFIGFAKKLQNDMQESYDAQLRSFWTNYKEDHKTPVISWIDSTSFIECQEKIAEDRDRQHTSCFRNVKLNKQILKVEDFSVFDQLETEFPNFKEVIQLYRGFFVLNSTRQEKNYQAPRPILLLGEPGIGKTRFAKKLAQALGTDYKFLDSNSITSGAVLTGHNASWRGADAGFVFKTLAPCTNLSPILLLDEVDKLSANREYSPFSTFHQLLEPENSSKLYDEFLELEFNASYVIYILTANNIKDIPESLLSRMNVFEIKKPDNAQMKVISQNIFSELLAGSKLFKETLSDEALNILAELAPRDVYQVLSKNLFNLSATQKKKSNNDFILEKQDKKQYKIGF